ncbi:MAG: cysteine desulfurase [Nanoarchaeota archaeon]|nr:cysteine desulfurase [Nanoarchaeota archaeon]
MYNVDKIREDFPILKRKVHGRQLVYLDNAASTQKPIQVIDAWTNYYKEHNSNVHRGVHALSQEASLMHEEAHVKVGKFVGAKNPMEETVFVRNATEAANIVAYGWGMHELKAGDEVLSTVMEHHANIVPWQFLKDRGVKINFVDIDSEGNLNIEDMKEKLTKKTRLVTCVHASNVLGTINDAKEIGKIAHDNGSLFMLDGSQSVPHMQVDVKKLGCDFMIFSGHKMLAPMGTGALYAKKEILQKMHPFLGGGDMIHEVTLEKSTWNDLPWKFEAGTPDVGGSVAFSAAIDYLNKLGMDNVRKHEKEITKYAIDKLSGIGGMNIFGPKNEEKRSGLVAFNVGELHPHDVAGILDSAYSVAIRSGQHCAHPLSARLGQTSTNRASFYVYNTKQEIDILIEGILKVKEILGK